MNVYFCDVCGVRVTDTDLHSGHGMRRRNDVICAACLELGHGKGLFAQDGQKQMAMAGAESAAGSNGKHPGPAPTALAGAAPARGVASDVLSEARDRARTLDEDQPPSPVKPVSLLPAAPPGLEADSEADPAAETELPHETPEFEDTAKVPVVHQELSSVAAGFAALNPPAAKSSDTGTQDVLEVPPSKLDDSGSAAVISLQDDSSEAEKAETAISGKIDAEGVSVKGGQSAARRATSSSRVSKQAKSRNMRRGKPNNNQMLIMFSALGTVALLVFGIGLFTHMDHSSAGGKRTYDKVDVDLKNAVMAANAAVKEAQSTQSPDKAKYAISLIDSVSSQAIEFDKVAKSQGWSEDQVDEKVSELGVQDVKGMRKLLEDIVVKAQQNASP